MKEGWVYSTIEECCNVNYGTRVVRSQVSGNKYPVYGGGGETFRMDEYNRENCLIISRFAMSKQCTRIVAGKFFLNDSGLTVSPKISSGLLPELLDRYLLACNDKIYSFGRGSAQRNLNMAEFRKMEISYPTSISEQQVIVDYLDSSFAKIDAMKANAEKSLNEAKALFQSSLQQLLEPKEGWEEKNMKDICSIKSKLVNPTIDENRNLLHVGGANITSYTGELIDLKTAYEEGLTSGKFKFDKNAVLYNKIRPYLVKVARPEFSGLCSADMYPLTPNKSISRDFLYYLLTSEDFTAYAIKGSARAGMPKVNRDWLFAYRCYIPSYEVQIHIASTLDSIKSKVDQLQVNCDRITKECDALKQAILKQVFE